MYRKLTIGRGEENNILVPEQYDTVSNSHADIEICDDGRVYIVDHSSNGTFINGRRIDNSRVEITRTDDIRLSHSYQFSWRLIEPFLVKTPAQPDNAQRQNTPGRETEFIVQRRVNEASYVQQGCDDHARDIDAAKNKWNWGAFLLSWLWAAFHNCWWPLFVCLGMGLLSCFVILIPVTNILVASFSSLIGLGVSIYLGVKGNDIAWNNGCYDNIEHFHRVEKKWTVAGLIVLCVCFVLPILVMLSLFMFFPFLIF